MTEGLVALVNSKTPITNLIDSRFYPRKIPQGVNTYPAATWRMVNNQDNADFDGASTGDYASIDIQCYGKNYADTHELYETMRKELEDSTGTFGGVEISAVWYVPSGMEDYLDDLELYTKQLELKISYKRQP